jgi:hypothetical protein
MKENTLRILSRYKHAIVLSTAIIALTFYIIPIDHLFTLTASKVDAQRGGGGQGKYGQARFGTPPGHGGPNPGQGGGSPPGKTEGGSTTPPGLQDNPGHGSAANPQAGGSDTTDSTDNKPSKASDNGGSDSTDNKPSKARDKTP